MTVSTSCDLSCSEAASEGEEFSSRLYDIAGCDSSATDEDADYEPRPSRKRCGAPGGAVGGKKVKQEAATAEDCDAGLPVTDAGDVAQACQETVTHTLLPHKPLPPCPRPQHGRDLGCEGSADPDMELLGEGGCITGTTEQAERCSSATETTEKTAGTALL